MRSADAFLCCVRESVRSCARDPSRRVIEPERVLIVLTADLKERSALDLIELGLKLGQGEVAMHGIAS